MELFYTIAFRDHCEQEHYHSKPATLNHVFTLLDYKYLLLVADSHTTDFRHLQ